MSDKTLSTENQGDGVALINILFLRWKLDRNAAWYAREYGLDKSGNALRDYLASRHVLPEDMAEANALFAQAPESVRCVLEQPALVAKCSREKLSDEERAAVRVVRQWRPQPVDEPKRPAEREASSRRLAVPYAAVALLAVLFALATAIILPQLPAGAVPAAPRTLRDQVREQTADPQGENPGAQHQHAAEIANLRRAIHALQLPCTDPEDTGLRDALPEIGRYIKQMKAKYPDLSKQGSELSEQLGLLQKEYQALKKRFPANEKNQVKGKE